jgi:hypothetical protein
MSTAKPEHKLEKADVNYSKGHKNSKCKLCHWFRRAGLIDKYPDDGECVWVKGDIDPEYWCELFKLRK